MSISETISPLIGRWALAWFYLVGLQHLTRQFGAVAGQLAAHHVPVPQLVLLVAAVLLFMGVLSLAFGYHTRHGAILLFGMTLAVAVMMHDYWHIADPAQRQDAFEIFARDVAICGGLLLLVGMGPGPFAIDKTGAKKK